MRRQDGHDNGIGDLTMSATVYAVGTFFLKMMLRPCLMSTSIGLEVSMLLGRKILPSTRA